jgi:hypothetical protein
MNLTSAKSRAIAQGEVLNLFVKVFPGKTKLCIDEVWAETDEGFESNHIQNPPLSTTLQLTYLEEDTAKFYPGQHHIRIWGTDEGLHYVLTEIMIVVNPAFPFTEETPNKDYIYISKPSVKTETDQAIVEGEVLYQGQAVSPAQWASAVIIRSPEEGLPDYGYPGDICKLTYDPPTYWTCVSSDPLEWRKFISNVFVGSDTGSVPPSNPLTQHMYLRGDGLWHVPDSSTIDTHNLIVVDEDTVTIDCQPF